MDIMISSTRLSPSLKIYSMRPTHTQCSTPNYPIYPTTTPLLSYYYHPLLIDADSADAGTVKPISSA